MPDFVARLDILPPAQRALWPLLGPTVPLGFVLYGGTAVPLRYANRRSVDFDFFGPRPLDKDALRMALREVVGSGRVIQDRPDSLSVRCQGVQVSFFGTGFERLAEGDSTHDGVLLVASPVDLLAHKLKTISQRAEAKDYQDIDALLAGGTSLEDGLRGARHLFGEAFQPAEACRALCYFDDLRDLAPEVRHRLVAAAAQVEHRRSLGPWPRDLASEPPREARPGDSAGLECC